MFDVEKVKEQLIIWIRDWFERNGKGCNAIVGLSGGKDSTCVAALCVEALGKDRVIGVSMPDRNQSINDADKIAEFLGIRYICAPIDSMTAGFRETALKLGIEDFAWSKQAEMNIPARIRMTTLYALAQSFNGRVSCNCNLSEDWVGYSTRWGDDAGDFRPISKLTVTEVRALGHSMGLPGEWVDKTPDDGLPNSSPDEVKLGFTYETLDKYIRGIETPDEATKANIDRRHALNLFKLSMPECYDPDPSLI